MKKQRMIFSCILTLMLIVVMAIPATGFAAESVGDEDSLKRAVAAGGEVTLTSDITIASPIVIDKSVTLNLNGNRIIAKQGGLTSWTLDKTETDAVVIVKRGGNLEVNGPGEIDYNGNASVLVGIKMTSSTDADGLAAKLTVNGGIITGHSFGISGNGLRHGTEILINGGIIKGANAAGAVGIYHPQEGRLTVKGGIVTGATGIEMRAGTLRIEGGTIEATYDGIQCSANGSGSTTKGAALAVAEHVTNKGVKVDITGGTFKAAQNGRAVNTAVPENSAPPDNVRVDINGGTFEGPVDDNKNGGMITIESAVLKGGYSLTEGAITAGDWVRDDNGVNYIGKDNVAAVLSNAVEGDEIRVVKLSNNQINVAPGVGIFNLTGAPLVINGKEYHYVAGQDFPFVAEKPVTPTTPEKDDPAKTSQPKTSDDSNLTIPLTLAGLALAGMAAVAGTRRRRS